MADVVKDKEFWRATLKEALRVAVTAAMVYLAARFGIPLNTDVKVDGANPAAVSVETR